MDIADLAQEREEAIITAALSSRRKKIQSPDGVCIWCRDERVVPSTAFCSAECGEDYHKFEREKKQRILRDV
ncbi:TraR/DksA C4-type zinc finger protein [Candidatus Tachikawaea gelatinosa]|uniref:Conserved uncharacterized protein n=1 Tax=Candidatus Tachikawaea gelatinosa TaxID=1410383 RepID=A0A090ARX1_9ENTR|nr:hypothetical protein [Candidatus Tachikawaea gelatinosa]BAP58580.1 conserved uncharacterized protein [Candidatus Tachikawaea gelatinosa]